MPLFTVCEGCLQTMALFLLVYKKSKKNKQYNDMKQKSTSVHRPNIPLLDCPFDYIIGDASGKVLNEYARFPCKIACGVYALIVRGSAKATINITQYDFKENDLLWLEPGGFLLIHEFTEDALVYYVLFSSSFMEKNMFSPHLNLNPMALRTPLIHLQSDVAQVYKSMIQVMIDAGNCEPSQLSSAKMIHVANLLHTCYYELHNNNQPFVKSLDRKQEIYQTYAKLVLEHYHEWHQVSQYADAMHVTMPHLSSTIRSVSGRTAGDLIVDAIVTDAKSQLKITTQQIKEIAINLGFENVAFFNRFFKAHTGTTPKLYRNS